MPRILALIPARMYDKKHQQKAAGSRVVLDSQINNYAKLPELFHVRKHGVVLDVVTTINNGREVQALSSGRQVLVLKNGILQEVK